MFKAEPEPYPEGMKCCPIMSDSQHRVLCQGSNCYAAYPVEQTGETGLCCKLIDGQPLPVIRRDHDK